VREVASRVAPLVDDFPAFCEGVLRLSKVDLRRYKRGQMERRIRSFAQRRGKADLLDYLALLAADPGELDQLLDRVTINVSQLWRNPVQWQTLAEQALPQLARSGRIRAWSAGCSYGAEVYTIAALCRAAAPATSVSVRGTDIDERMIARARQGHFSDSDMRTVPPDALERWFEQTADGWSVSRELAGLVSFEVENLLECEPQPAAFDLIACRNLVIYFTEESRVAVHRMLAASLRPGGWLMVGSTERIPDARAYGLELVYPFTYRKS
jgi:chemotaxis protein methyltransferase CheR